MKNQVPRIQVDRSKPAITLYCVRYYLLFLENYVTFTQLYY